MNRVDIVKKMIAGINDKSSVKKISWKSLKTFLSIGAVLLLVVVGVFYFSSTTSAVDVLINGKSYGYAASMAEAKNAIADVLKNQGQEVGCTALTNDNIEYKKIRIKNELYEKSPLSDAILSRVITPYIESCALTVDGEKIAVLKTKEEAEKVLQDYIDFQTKPSEKNIVDSVEFVETIEKGKVQAHPSKIMTAQEALEILKKGDITVKNYTIEKNDSWWLIARKHDMLTDEILSGNPDFTEDSIIQPGQEIKIVKVEPFINVISKGTKEVNEVIPFDVVTQTDNSLPYGQRVVKQAGKDGEKTVTYSYVEENGKTVEKEVLKEKVITEPVKQVVAKGPNPPVTIGYSTSRGSGKISGMIWPIQGRITSYFGYRWGGFHKGLDIDGFTGQPIGAAAGGKVVAAGWSGNYGYMVLIDHGNGVVTRYAHCSKLSVSTGQTVSQGQTIALVGSTGRSTGSHLHFEVIINGNTVNPLNYV